MEKLLDVLKSLSDETRLRILNLLYEQELCVCDVMETLQISQAKASRHLIYLKNSGLVKDRKNAQWVNYTLTRDERFLFIDHLVHGTLRSHELYQKDLANLASCLKQKKPRTAR